jgi:hypothetical protein
LNIIYIIKMNSDNKVLMQSLFIAHCKNEDCKKALVPFNLLSKKQQHKFDIQCGCQKGENCSGQKFGLKIKDSSHKCFLCGHGLFGLCTGSGIDLHRCFWHQPAHGTETALINCQCGATYYEGNILYTNNDKETLYTAYLLLLHNIRLFYR